MGDRANIFVKDTENGGVYLYTHWSGWETPAILQRALAKHWRWNDSQYLARIIFDELLDGHHGGETDYGISSYCRDGSSRVLTVNCFDQRVICRDLSWSFEEYINIPVDQLRELTWEYGQ